MNSLKTRRGKYSKRKVYCPNASRLGYSEWEASPGDVIVWKYYGSLDEHYIDRAKAEGRA